MLALGATVAFALIINNLYFGATAVVAIDDIGEGVAAAIACLACAWAAQRAPGNDRLGWMLMSISTGLWAAGEAVWTIYEVGLGVDVPYPSLADVGFLAAIPFAFAGIRAFWGDARGTSERLRVWLDGAIVALALFSTAWAFGLRAVFFEDADNLRWALDLAYPLGDLLVGTVLILAIRRARNHQHGRMFFLLAGVAAYSIADSAFSYLSALDTYAAAGSVLDTGWFAGFLMIGLAAVYPPPSFRQAHRQPLDLWQLALPWFTLLLAAVADLFVAVTNRELDLFQTALTGVIALLVTVNMVLERREYLGVLLDSQRSQATLAEIIARAPVAIARATADLTVLDVNSEMETMFRTKKASLLGSNVAQYIPADARAALMERLGGIIKGEVDSADGESPMTRGDGSTMWTQWKTAVVRTAAGEIDYFITMIEDMDARHEAEVAAQETLTTLDRLNRLKTEFLQSVSHEFKTALIGIQGFSEFMRDSDQLELKDVRGFAEDIHRDAERLDRLVTEMVSLDRVETERANLQLAAVALNPLIESEVAAAKSTASVTIVTVLEPGLPAVKGDASKLGEVVRTLLTNALKYSPNGGTITVTTGAEGDSVIVSVKDQGTAARGDFDNRLFGGEDLYAENPIRKIVGTGLGLGIARQIVEMHAGRLWVDRIEDAGSVFHFALPAVKSAVPVGSAA